MKEKIPDKRAMERMTSDLTRMLQGKNFNSKEDLDDYLKGVVRKGRIPKMPPKSAVQLAQDIMYEAWEAKDDKERIKLARGPLRFPRTAPMLMCWYRNFKDEIPIQPQGVWGDCGQSPKG